jgi:hypothetical protein
MPNTAHLRTTHRFVHSITTLTITTAVLLFVGTHAFAQQPTAPIPGVIPDQFFQLTALPPRIGDDLSIKGVPGEVLQVAVRVKNSSAQDLPIRSFMQDFVVEHDGTQPVPVTEQTNSRWSLAEWVTVFPETQDLKAGETGIVNLLIEVPPDALPGGRYAMVVHEPNLSDSPVERTQAGIAQQIGTLVYLTVDGPINEEAYLSTVEFPTFVQNGPIPFSFAFDNRSDIHLRPAVSVEIRNMLGQLSGVIDIEPQNVFPFTQRTFRGEWTKIWGFGKYTALITASYGSQGQVARAVATFWMIPLQLLLAVAVALATLIVLTILIRRYLLHKNDLKTKQIELLEEKIKHLEDQKADRYSDENQS